MIIIISDRSRNNLKSGGAWITANTKGNSIIEGTNPNFGIIKRMHSNRAEIFGILSALTFLKKQCTQFLIEFNYPVKYYCNNLQIVNKIKIMLVNPNAFDKKYHIADYDVMLQIKKNIFQKMKVHYVFGHQDKSKDKCLTLQAKLNIRVDKLIFATTRKSLQTNIK